MRSGCAIIGRLNLAALRTLCDLLVAHADCIGTGIGRAVAMAGAGDPAAALAGLEGMSPERVAKHQPWRVARSHVALLAGHPLAASAGLAKAIDLTRDLAVRDHLAERLAALEAVGAEVSQRPRRRTLGAHRARAMSARRAAMPN